MRFPGVSRFQNSKGGAPATLHFESATGERERESEKSDKENQFVLNGRELGEASGTLEASPVAASTIVLSIVVREERLSLPAFPRIHLRASCLRIVGVSRSRRIFPGYLDYGILCIQGVPIHNVYVLSQ